MTRILRAAAVAIALLGAIDPVVAITRATRPHVAMVVQPPESEAADRVRAQLAHDLGGTYDLVPHAASDSAAVIVIGDRYPTPDAVMALTSSADGDSAAIANRVISTVTLPASPVSITRISAPREVPPATAIRIDADVDGRLVYGRSTDVVARIAGVEIGRATHQWTAPAERWRATIDAVPFGEPPFVIRVEAGGSAADVVVGLRTRPIRIEAYDPRPSWASTFTRRAVESDPRFQVESIVDSSRGIAARTAGAVTLTDSRLDGFDAVLVGGLEALTLADARALDRYMRVRGGSVVLLPDARAVSAAAHDLLAGGRRTSALFIERLLDRPAVLNTKRGVATLQASEILLPTDAQLGDERVAAMPGEDEPAVIILTPRGSGRLLVSGASDAWRYRAAPDSGFDRFWQAALAGVALATPPLLDVHVAPAVLSPGEAADVVVRTREGIAAETITASVDGRPIRLWPAAERGEFRGRFVAPPNPRRSVVRAVASGDADRTAARVVPVRDQVRHVSDADVAPLAMLASAHHGIDVDSEHLADLERFTRHAVNAPRISVAARPMRSPWWMLPFAGCLAGEWWSRRRRGLK